MDIDNSRAQAFRRCPDLYKEKYLNHLERRWGSASPYDFGKYFHVLLEHHFKDLGGIPHDNLLPEVPETTRLECEATFAAYCASYSIEPFSVVSVEQTFKLAIPGSHHRYIGKFDGIIRYNQNSQWPDQLAILEHKTEKRNALKNLPKAWAARAQVSLYAWAAEQLYGEPISHILLDVIRRQSPKGQEHASFYRDTLERTRAQQLDALKDLCYVADQIEQCDLEYAHAEHWPRNTDECCIGNFECDMYPIHVGGETPELIKIHYRPAEEYLTL